MRTSCIPLSLCDQICNQRTMSLDDWARMARTVGLDAIEMYVHYLDEFSPEQCRRAAATLARHDLPASMFTSYADFGSADPQYRAEQANYVKLSVDAARIFGTDIVRVTAGQFYPEVSHEGTLDLVADGLRQCLDYAEGRGVRLALEDHPEIGEAVDDFVEIVRRVDDVRLKVNLDTSNPMAAGDTVLDLIPHVADRIVHVHVSDRQPDLSHVAIGDGAVDFPTIFRLLAQAGYDGWLSLEAAGEPTATSLQRQVDYVRRTWAAASGE